MEWQGPLHFNQMDFSGLDILRASLPLFKNLTRYLSTILLELVVSALRLLDVRFGVVLHALLRCSVLFVRLRAGAM